MGDLLVRLYDLPPLQSRLDAHKREGIILRAALPPERHVVISWISTHFPGGWASECKSSFARLPVSCFLAVKEKEILGFACYEATARDFFGPLGVREDCRTHKLGSTLTLACLHAMKELGYGYAIIGGGGWTTFYSKFLDVMEIPKSDPGIYAGML